MSMTEILEAGRSFEHPENLDEPVQHQDTQRPDSE
jgi:hypothetical protein